MLNGLDPIVIFNFFKKTPELENSLTDLPLVSTFTQDQALPPIPVYLSYRLTGLLITSQEKNIDIETRIDGVQEVPVSSQRPLNSIVRVTMEANERSIGVVLLSALCEFIFSQVTNNEYSITYLSGPVTVFNGLLHGFSVQQDSDTDKFTLVFEIARTRGQTRPGSPIPSVENSNDLVPA
jgi:hypothetical protein